MTGTVAVERPAKKTTISPMIRSWAPSWTPSPEGKSIPYLDNAPPVLIKLHQRTQESRYNDLFGRLLTDERMKPVWRQLEKRLVAGSGNKGKARGRTGYVPERLYEKLWSEIYYAVARCGQPPVPRSNMRHRFEQLALDAVELAEAITSGPLDLSKEVEHVRQKSRRKFGHTEASTSAPLDLLAYEFFPEDLATRAFREAKWAQLGPGERYDVAHQVLEGVHWPSFTDLLTEFARRAVQEAQNGFSAPRIVDRNREYRKLNFFVRHLYIHFFRPDLHGRMAGTLAHIASVAFKEDITKESVVQALRHAKA